jgi:carbon catabolite-derepressing protein kinase
MNLQLYMVDSINYLVDFHHKKTYRASTEEGAEKFGIVVSDSKLTEEELAKREKEPMRDDEVVSPYVFMDVACKLILELAGGVEQ